MQPSNVSLFPVSVSFSPPFTMMTHLVGQGDRQAGADVSAAITSHGTWQPGVGPYRQPAVVEALVGALSKHYNRQGQGSSRVGVVPAASGAENVGHLSADRGRGSNAIRSATVAAGNGNVQMAAVEAPRAAAAAKQLEQQKSVLVDVGAGHGFFSLAAAARGHHVVAFESSTGSLAAFKASIAYNGFDSAIELHEREVLGATSGAICLQWQWQQQQEQEQQSSAQPDEVESTASGTAGAGASTVLTAAADNGSASNVLDSQPSASGTGASHRLLQQQDILLRRRRGYPHLSDGPTAAPTNTSQDMTCAVLAQRRRLSDVLGNTTSIAAMRLSAHGHEGWVLQGALDFLRHVHRPDVIHVEFCPAAMRAAGFDAPVQLLSWLFELGYTDIAHAGRVCDHRWVNATSVLRAQVSNDD